MLAPLRSNMIDDASALEEADHAHTISHETSHTAVPPRLTVADGLSFIVHSHLRWDFVWQRPQQIFSRLARQHRILFVEEACDGVDTPALDLSEPHPNVVRAVPRLPGAAGMSVDQQHQMMLPLLEHALRTHPLLAGRFHRFVQWFYSPMPARSALERLAGVAVVYDCMDELANFRFAPPDITQRERQLLAHADVVFTGGHALFEAKSRHHDNVHFFGCGVDAKHFGQARSEELEVVQELTRLPKPVLGYFGVIDERLDYGLIERLSQVFADCSIAMVGPLAKVEPEQLPASANIHWLGQRDYAQLPALVKGFDVCLMPFALNDATRYINPTKTLEYMAAGKPVVSSAVPDVLHNFAQYIAVARSHDEFIAEVRRALTEPDTARIARALAHADACGWDAIVASMRAHIVRGLMRA